MSTTINTTYSRISNANKPQVPADGTATAAIAVRLRNDANEPLAGRQVELSANRQDVVVTQPGLTNNEGVAFGYVSSKTRGPVTIRGLVLVSQENLSSPEALEKIEEEAAGSVWLENSVTVYFYARDLMPAPKIEETPRNVHLAWSVSRYYLNDIDGIRVRIEADEATDMPTKIFAYQLLPVKPGETESVGAFDHVCSSVDLEEYPEDVPGTNSRPAWFRLNYVDVLLRSREEVREFINSVIEDVNTLKNTLDIAEELLPSGDLWIGTPPD